MRGTYYEDGGYTEQVVTTKVTEEDVIDPVTGLPEIDPVTGQKKTTKTTTTTTAQKLRLEGSIFRSNHASNYLALNGTLPKDQATLLRALDAVLAHPSGAPFRPEWMRGL